MKIKMLIAVALLVSVISLLAGEASVTLTWTARPASENVQFYVVSESLTPGRAIVVITTTNTYTIHNVANGEHFYFVSGLNSFGEGIPTLPFRVNIFAQPFGSPGIPANLNGNVNYLFP
jgi:hypothetical protein